ncbi:hypothetical protein [Testudinibacter aquarius]|uniref:Uncharacterized protein n=1 Tax=Testudinibacter aquarius TaxID=1524974 RepID=A0A4R3Y9D7_9PAST|nr:hypothetical protein [Testudinibacter aquarius]KAE9526051.1 hypothetical protein A1D24_03195 [Testudinibacter aquarius]TCV87244.1 hypothetical protein EDC16_105163 [Testudinibacter aquarius]TNG91286.1 hypothetical protein FHQ21_08275 [Testudinibacter aquarius]
MKSDNINQYSNGNVENMVAGDQHNHFYQGNNKTALSIDEREKLVQTITDLKTLATPTYWAIYNHCKAQHGHGWFKELNDEHLQQFHAMAKTLIPVALVYKNQMSDDKFRFSHSIIFKLYQFKIWILSKRKRAEK